MGSRLPNEVFFEAFKFLNRRQLTNLERVCLRVHRIINDHIGEAPFLRLDFGVGFNASGLVTKIGAEGNLAAILKNVLFPFLRFKTLWMFYNEGSISIDEKLQLLHYYLRLFETALSNLDVITLTARINQNDQSQFRDHSQLLDHLREQVLPICDSSPVHYFDIDFQSDNDAAGNVIGQFLQLPSINRCQKVGFNYTKQTFIQLPVDAISNWLNRNSDDGIGRNKKERFLGTNHRIRVQNAEEICDRMRKAFNEADAPAPFSFGFFGGPIEMEVLFNEKTNEELAMRSADFYYGMRVEIIRSAKEKKNSRRTE